VASHVAGTVVLVDSGVAHLVAPPPRRDFRHYFGSKAALFRATMGWPFDPADIVANISAGGRRAVGERLTRVFFELWEHPQSRSPPMAILRGAATHDESAVLVRQFITGQVYPQIARVLGGRDAELRVDLAMGQLLGIAYLRHILEIEPIASQPGGRTDRPCRTGDHRSPQPAGAFTGRPETSAIDRWAQLDVLRSSRPWPSGGVR
jgi:hypothetical protein